jgi:hypothetical protein
MSTVLGLIIFVVYIVCVVGAAAGVTWVVVRLTPKREPKPSEPS